MDKGTIFKFHNDLDTDQIIASQYLLLPNLDEMKSHTFESLDPDFSKKVKPGDFVVGGENFGCGSSREQAPGVLKALGVKAVIAKSFARIFFRNAINLIGLPDYLISVATPFMSAAWLPVITFVLVGLVCFATATIWSIPAVCTPIILPLAAACGASIPLTLGAIISAACFGAQACFYSDVTLMSASACKINNVDYAVAQLPYIGIVAGVTCVLFLGAGFVLAA